MLGYGIRNHVSRVGNEIEWRAGIVVLAMLAGRADIGLFAAVSVIVMRLGAISDSVGAVLYPRLAASAVGHTEVLGRCLRLVGLATGSALLAVLALAEPLVQILLSKAFLAAVPLIWILAPGVLAGAASGMFFTYFQGTNRPGICSWAVWFGLTANIAALWTLYPVLGIASAAWALRSARRFGSSLPPSSSTPSRAHGCAPSGCRSRATSPICGAATGRRGPLAPVNATVVAVVLATSESGEALHGSKSNQAHDICRRPILAVGRCANAGRGHRGPALRRCDAGGASRRADPHRRRLGLDPWHSLLCEDGDDRPPPGLAAAPRIGGLDARPRRCADSLHRARQGRRHGNAEARRAHVELCAEDRARDLAAIERKIAKLGRFRFLLQRSIAYRPVLAHYEYCIASSEEKMAARYTPWIWCRTTMRRWCGARKPW